MQFYWFGLPWLFFFCFIILFSLLSHCYHATNRLNKKTQSRETLNKIYWQAKNLQRDFSSVSLKYEFSICSFSVWPTLLLLIGVQALYVINSFYALYPLQIYSYALGI